MEGFYSQKEGGTRKLKEWIISGRSFSLMGRQGSYQAGYPPSADLEIPELVGSKLIPLLGEAETAIKFRC